MTYRELNSLYYIRREIARDEREIEKLRRRAVSSSTALSEETAGPHAGVSDKVGATVALIVDLTRELAEKTRELAETERRITLFILGVEDARTRLLLKLRFIDNLPWFKVAMEIGGGNTDQTVRKAFSRWARENLDDRKPTSEQIAKWNKAPECDNDTGYCIYEKCPYYSECIEI